MLVFGHAGITLGVAIILAGVLDSDHSATSHNWWKFDLTISYTLLPSQSIPLSNQYFF